LDEINEKPHDQQPTRLLLARALRRARGSLLWERLWPALASITIVLGLFLAFSWAGLWLMLPPLARAIGLIIFGLLLIAAAVPLAILRLPSVNDGLRRLDRRSGEIHRPATAVSDHIAANGTDPVTQALWQAHVERADLSQIERAAPGTHEQTAQRPRRIARLAEQLALDHAGWHARASNIGERGRRASGPAVNEACDQRLPRPVLPADGDRRIARRGALDERQHGPHRRVLRHQLRHRREQRDACIVWMAICHVIERCRRGDHLLGKGRCRAATGQDDRSVARCKAACSRRTARSQIPL